MKEIRLKLPNNAELVVQGMTPPVALAAICALAVVAVVALLVLGPALLGWIGVFTAVAA